MVCTREHWWSALEKLGATSTGLVVALILGCAAIASGLSYNGTHSFPVGLYLASHKRPENGELGKERGYLNVASLLFFDILVCFNPITIRCAQGRNPA
jgi:hypothetical protein